MTYEEYMDHDGYEENKNNSKDSDELMDYYNEREASLIEEWNSNNKFSI